MSYSGPLPWVLADRREGVETEFNCEYKEKWEYKPRSRVGVSGWRITKRKHQGSGEILTKPTWQDFQWLGCHTPITGGWDSIPD